MAPTDDLAQRLAAVERRLAALEAAPAPTPPAQESDSETFWALDGLRRRLPAPGGVLFTGTVDLPTGEHLEWQQAALTDDVLAPGWQALADRLDALASPVRLLLLRLILSGVRTVSELGEHEDLGTSGQLYHHLRQLTAAGWVHTCSRGQYSVPPQRVIALLVILTATQGL